MLYGATVLGDRLKQSTVGRNYLHLHVLLLTSSSSSTVQNNRVTVIQRREIQIGSGSRTGVGLPPRAIIVCLRRYLVAQSVGGSDGFTDGHRVAAAAGAVPAVVAGRGGFKGKGGISNRSCKSHPESSNSNLVKGDTADLRIHSVSLLSARF